MIAFNKDSEKGLEAVAVSYVPDSSIRVGVLDQPEKYIPPNPTYFNAHRDLEGFMSDYSRGLNLGLDSSRIESNSKKKVIESYISDRRRVDSQLKDITENLRGYSVRQEKEGRSKPGTFRRTWKARADYLGRQLSGPGEDNLNSVLSRAVANGSMNVEEAQKSIDLVYNMLNSALLKNRYLTRKYGKETVKNSALIKNKPVQFVRIEGNATVEESNSSQTIDFINKAYSDLNKLKTSLNDRTIEYSPYSIGAFWGLGREKTQPVKVRGFITHLNPLDMYGLLRYKGVSRSKAFKSLARKQEFPTKAEPTFLSRLVRGFKETFLMRVPLYTRLAFSVKH